MPLTLLWRGPDESPLGTCPGAGQSSVGLCHVPQSPVGRLRLLPRGGSAEVAAVTGSSTVLGRRPGSRGLRGVCGTQAAPPRDSGGAWGSPRVLCPAVLWSDSAGPGICSGALRAVSLHDVHCSDQGRKPRSQKGRSPLIPIPRISKCSKGCGVCFPPMLLETFSQKRRGRPWAELCRCVSSLPRFRGSAAAPRPWAAQVASFHSHRKPIRRPRVARFCVS